VLHLAADPRLLFLLAGPAERRAPPGHELAHSLPLHVEDLVAPHVPARRPAVRVLLLEELLDVVGVAVHRLPPLPPPPDRAALLPRLDQALHVGVTLRERRRRGARAGRRARGRLRGRDREAESEEKGRGHDKAGQKGIWTRRFHLTVRFAGSGLKGTAAST